MILRMANPSAQLIIFNTYYMTYHVILQLYVKLIGHICSHLQNFNKILKACKWTFSCQGVRILILCKRVVTETTYIFCDANLRELSRNFVKNLLCDTLRIVCV